ncbi:MAG TPA: hypothetical protein VKE72_05240 [Methylocella sp.]|jgi:hypothetical protein|nr:hypothetical protein [Methylocella sp.]
MPHAVTIESLPAAFEMMKAKQAGGLAWGEDYRPLARKALTAIIEGACMRRLTRIFCAWRSAALLTGGTEPTTGAS